MRQKLPQNRQKKNTTFFQTIQYTARELLDINVFGSVWRTQPTSTLEERGQLGHNEAPPDRGIQVAKFKISTHLVK